MKVLLLFIFSTVLFAQNHGSSGTAGGTADFTCGSLLDSIQEYQETIISSYKQMHPQKDLDMPFKEFLKMYYMELILASTSNNMASEKEAEQVICETNIFNIDNLEFLRLSQNPVDFDYDSHKKLNTLFYELIEQYSYAIKCNGQSVVDLKLKKHINNQPMVYAVYDYFQKIIKITNQSSN